LNGDGGSDWLTKIAVKFYETTAALGWDEVLGLVKNAVKAELIGPENIWLHKISYHA
jgi:mannose/cellobiose epimerase-like protein (N-acyl-D-glucosamine 2-epimerase family)